MAMNPLDRRGRRLQPRRLVRRHRLGLGGERPRPAGDREPDRHPDADPGERPGRGEPGGGGPVSQPGVAFERDGLRLGSQQRRADRQRPERDGDLSRRDRGDERQRAPDRDLGDRGGAGPLGGAPGAEPERGHAWDGLHLGAGIERAAGERTRREHQRPPGHPLRQPPEVAAEWQRKATGHQKGTQGLYVDVMGTPLRINMNGSISLRFWGD